jgi:hypothetical protein
MNRWAVVRNNNPDKIDSIKDLLPRNYEVVRISPDGEGVLICGTDDHGWTMEQYVIPRLGSGLHAAREVFPGFFSKSPRGVIEWEMRIPDIWLEKVVS